MQCDSYTQSEDVIAALQQQTLYDLAIIEQSLLLDNAAKMLQFLQQLPNLSALRLVLLLPFGHASAAELKHLIEVYVTVPIRLRQLHHGLQRALSLETLLNKNSQGSLEKTQARLQVMLLLVEDSYINQQVASIMLESLGCRVDIASDGKQAIELFEQSLETHEPRYVLVFMDCQMSCMDGLEATRLLRELEQVQALHTPFIALTAFTLTEIRSECLAAGMDDFME